MFILAFYFEKIKIIFKFFLLIEMSFLSWLQGGQGGVNKLLIIGLLEFFNNDSYTHTSRK